MDLAIILDIMVQDITRQDTIGALMGMCITGIPIGIAGTGGITDGTIVEGLKRKFPGQVDEIDSDNVPGVFGVEIGCLAGPVLRGTRNKRGTQP